MICKKVEGAYNVFYSPCNFGFFVELTTLDWNIYGLTKNYSKFNRFVFFFGIVFPPIIDISNHGSTKKSGVIFVIFSCRYEF